MSQPVGIPIRYQARELEPSEQDSLPGRYPWWVMMLAMAAFTLAFLGWLNETWLYLYESPIWLNRYTEYAIILAFGLWRIRAEKNRYTRKRLIILVSVVTVIWWLVPWLAPRFEPYVGYLWSQPVFPALHTPGTLSFFLVLVLVFLFGRRIICGFGCPCVGIRETVGFPFRRFTLRSDWAWKLRHLKWFFFVWYVGVMVATQFPPNSWTVSLVGSFGLVVGLTYFATFFLMPLTGNRFYCRTLCPFGATFGLLNHAGFYRIAMDKDKCIRCARCEQACDMGIPVMRQGQAHGQITGLEDCMGCARCITACPTDALEIKDVRNLFRPALRQDASHLLKRKAQPESGPATPSALTLAQQQAQRCLDCGEPGCRNACPLHNRIPDWMAAAAKGEWGKAGALVNKTSPMPEICAVLCPQHRLCEGACTRKHQDGAVRIGVVERTLAEYTLTNGWQPQAPKHRQTRSVAVVGAGPAGIACAEHLNAAGVLVDVYDRNPGIGGLLLTAVPDFKLEKGWLAKRQELLRQAGVCFHFGKDVGGKDITQELLATHDAVFLGLGAQQPKTIGLPGQHLAGVMQALPFLEQSNHEASAGLSGQTLLVVGGGDTAMDAARRAIRLGASVLLAYRGPESGLRASPREILAAKEEGVTFLFRQKPLECQGAEKLEGVCFETAESRHLIPCDRLVLALGQQPAPPPWLAELGIMLEEDGRIRVDQYGRTSHPAVWAGGDNAHGPALAVNAMAAGRRAAEDMLANFSLLGRLRRKV